ncbi:hypothetical protein BT63DRAFT_67982 [Microthyrium microscopicum]|uniref:Uncharacterized protein n=1 Tax=Microthyrium microscopicum TaxID=703497 RepID=A0A6A6TZL9_9PEZI|nr:hypothetical protein BT63DRAFT_67982 [Microthyrium microscopicum]
MDDGRHLTNRLLSRIPFVRTSLEETRPSLSELAHKSPPTSPPPRRRPRKGSLRKVLLTTGHIASSRRAGEFNRDPLKSLPHDIVDSAPAPPADQSRDHYGSTTDEDNDGLTLRARSASGTYQPLPGAPSGAPIVSRRKSMRSSGPIPVPIAMPTSIPKSIDDLAPAIQYHDYSETEWWGWIILAVTWIVFVVGMGSCLEVWSWAWDVGETPYAPPELEDDPTLPIVGYYPALIVMTGVMAWVWVMVAWVGMKYFRHAKVWDGEEY